MTEGSGESRAFLIFLGYGSQNRTEVVRELEMAVKKQHKNPEYVILPVFLNRIPITDFPEQVRPVLIESQNIGMWLYGGVTERFIDRIVNTESWNCGVIDAEYRKKKGLAPWQPGVSGHENIEYRPEDQKTYIYHYADPPLCEQECAGKVIRFYKVSPGEVSPHAVYPVVMDNQWCPVSFYGDSRFLRYGFASDELNHEREMMQRYEVFRGLLHSRQLLVNRAFLQNSAVFVRWYKDKSAREYSAFCRLLENGSVVLALYREKIPFEETAYGNTAWGAWKRLCMEHTVYCLRMDWEDDETNRAETDTAMGLRFHNYCVTTAENPYRMEKMTAAFSLSDDQAEQMRKKWKQIQKNAVRTREKYGKGYSREQFYKDCIVVKDSPVVECRISRKKPFAEELKQMIDLRYNLNFAQAFGIRPLLPREMAENPVSEDVMTVSRGREITAEELIYAVGTFCPDTFLEEICVPRARELHLDQIEAMRRLPGWEKYIRLIEEADTRAEQWDIDFAYVTAVWKAYKAWMDKARENLPELGWLRQPGCVTIVYRIGGKEVRTAYRQGIRQPTVTETGSSVGKGKQTITIDYICGEESGENSDSCFLTEIRLFFGRTHERGTEVYSELKKRFCGGSNI